jgi:hypothetical protein
MGRKYKRTVPYKYKNKSGEEVVGQISLGKARRVKSLEDMIKRAKKKEKDKEVY